MPEKQIFFDPHRKRWKRLRRILDTAAVVFTLVLAGFIFNTLRGQHLPELLLPTPKHNYRAVTDRTPLLHRNRSLGPARRKTTRRPSEIPLNTGEGLRAAYYVPDDATSYSSFKEHVHQIDLLFPQWLHVDLPAGRLMARSGDNTLREFPVVDGNTVHDPDDLNKIKNVIQQTKEDTEIFPQLNNYNAKTGVWDAEIGKLLADDGQRAHLRDQIVRFFTALPVYRGLALDFESLDPSSIPAYINFIHEIYGDLHARNLRLYVNVPAAAEDAYLKQIAPNTDGVVLMNYDQHEIEGEPGPIAAQDWFIGNLARVLKVVPKEKLICAIGNYGYDWTLSIPDPKDKRHPQPKVIDAEEVDYVSEVWKRAADADADLNLDYDTLNPHFEYIDEDSNQRHVVWFLDAVTALNELRGARALGLQTFALWRLGEEDSSIWNIWDRPSNPDALHALTIVQPGNDIDTEGDGEIIRVTGLPKNGKRTVEIDTDEPDPRNALIIDEHMDVYPNTYTVQQYGYHPNKVALSFDDGPDPKWTPRILDILKRKGAHGTFMLIGDEAQQNIGLMQRIVREGNEIGNHTYTHPPGHQRNLAAPAGSRGGSDGAAVCQQAGGAAALFPAAVRHRRRAGHRRPGGAGVPHPAGRPHGGGQQAGHRRLGRARAQDAGGDSPAGAGPVEPNEGEAPVPGLDHPPARWGRRPFGDYCGAAGVDRHATRQHGYEIVQTSTLMGKTTADVMPRLKFWQRVRAIPDSVAFSALSIIFNFVVMVFFLGDALMSARLIMVGIFAIIDRLRRPHRAASPGYNPRVAVLIPAYNEEKVIVRTIRSVLNSDYTNLRIIVIDDGSSDRTAEVAQDAYAKEIRAGLVQVLVKANGGKAAALNYGLDYVDEEIYVGIDADTVIAMDAVSKLVPHFEDRGIGAVAGNAKVGNRVNTWTRWQALEYITSQNFERRAMDLFNVVTVVPGAIGAWRTDAVKQAGGYPINTVAEDADLTMSLLEHRLKVVYEDRALAFTEAPIDPKGLMRQRFRWSFGILQAVWKHRAAFVRNKAMGLFALPNIVVFQMLLPLVSPFIDIMFVYGILHYFIDLHYHPEAASAANFQKLLAFFLAFLVIDFLTSSVAFSLERPHPANKGDRWLLFHIWLQRFAYRQLFSVVLFKTVKRAIDGRPFNWDKLERTAKMSRQTEALTETR